MPVRPTSATVHVSFSLLSDRRDVWLAAWREVARMAVSQPACRRAYLLQDRCDSMRCVMLSEWDNAASFNRFVRESGLLWLEDALAYSHLRPQFAYFEAATDEPVKAECIKMPAELLLPV